MIITIKHLDRSDWRSAAVVFAAIGVIGFRAVTPAAAAEFQPECAIPYVAIAPEPPGPRLTANAVRKARASRRVVGSRTKRRTICVRPAMRRD